MTVSSPVNRAIKNRPMWTVFLFFIRRLLQSFQKLIFLQREQRFFAKEWVFSIDVVCANSYPARHARL